MAEARDFMFSLLDQPRRVLHIVDDEWLQRGRGQVNVTYFLKFGNPSITFERKKLDTSFFFVRSAVTSTTQRTMTDKWPLSGRGQSHVTRG